MKCQSCQADIPPCWVKAIETNICPGCGESIMQEEIVGLMKELADAFTKMEFNAQEITGWLLSNYRLEKVGDGEPTGFHRPKSGKFVISKDGADYDDEKTEKLNAFFKRASAPMSVVGAKKKNLLKRNQREQSEDIEDEGEDEGEEGDYSEDETPEEKIIEAKKKFIDPKYANVNAEDILSEEEIAAIEKRAAASKKLKKRAQVQAQREQEEISVPSMPEEYALLPDDGKMSPLLRAHNEKALQKIIESRENMTSGVRTNINGFSRG